MPTIDLSRPLVFSGSIQPTKTFPAGGAVSIQITPTRPWFAECSIVQVKKPGSRKGEVVTEYRVEVDGPVVMLMPLRDDADEVYSVNPLGCDCPAGRAKVACKHLVVREALVKAGVVDVR